MQLDVGSMVSVLMLVRWLVLEVELELELKLNWSS